MNDALREAVERVRCMAAGLSCSALMEREVADKLQDAQAAMTHRTGALGLQQDADALDAILTALQAASAEATNEEGVVYTAEQLMALLRSRDEFLASRGLFSEYADTLPNKAATPAERAAHLPASPEEGWKLVPVEPTREMITAGDQVTYTQERFKVSDCYRAMLQAAPPTPTPPETGA